MRPLFGSFRQVFPDNRAWRKGFELGRDFFGVVLGFAELFAQVVDVDFGEDVFNGAYAVEQDFYVILVLEVSYQWGFREHGAKHPA